MLESRLLRRHSVQPLLLEEVQPWGEETPFLPLQLLRAQKSKIKSLPVKLKKYESLVQLQSHQLPLREKPSAKMSQQVPKVNIKLYHTKKALLRMPLPSLERDKTERTHLNLRLKVLRESRQLQQELNVQRKIFLMLHDPERSSFRKSLM